MNSEEMESISDRYGHPIPQ